MAVSLVASFTSSLLSYALEVDAACIDGPEPWLLDVLAEARHDDPVPPSRLR